MSIASKHAYRFGYLQSEQWSNVRLEALAREGGKCQVCGHESISNDAHHVWYPKNIYETRAEHLVVLCRPCHNFIHSIRPECKTKDEAKGKHEWCSFLNAILIWRAEKMPIFTNGEGLKMVNPKVFFDKLMQAKQMAIQVSPKDTAYKSKIGAAFSELKQMAQDRFGK